MTLHEVTLQWHAGATRRIDVRPFVVVPSVGDFIERPDYPGLVMEVVRREWRETPTGYRVVLHCDGSKEAWS